MSGRELKTVLGSVPMKKDKRSSRVFSVETVVILEREGDSDHVYRLRRKSYEPKTRRDISRTWVQYEVARILEGRDDLEGMKVVRVEVNEISPVWRQPYEWETSS